MKASGLKALTSVMAIAWAGTACAQDLPAAADTAVKTEIAADEIVVTAQRRSERLVDVPISVSVASADDLQRAGPASLESLTKVTPGAYLQRATYGLSPTIRGIGSTLADSNNEQNVALYIDEIYYPVPTGNVFDLASVAGVEVLKGPQGTLFGRNATGGAILVRTLDPGFERAGRFSISYERFNEVRASAYLNVPLGDKVAINGSVAYRYSGGYVRDLKTDAITNEGRSFTARGKLLLQPTDNFSIIFTGAHADYDDPSGGDSRNFGPARILPLLGGGPIATDIYHSSYNTSQFIRTTTDEYSARAKLDIGDGTLKSFTAYLDNTLKALNDIDLSYAAQTVALDIYNKTFTQEVNYSSSQDGPLSYVVGVYYFHNKSGSFVATNGTPVTLAFRKNEAIAGYVDGTYELGDLSLIAGLRYTSDKRSTASAFGVTTPPYTRFQAETEKQWTPRLGLRFALGGRSNVYATYSKGFKSGVFDATTPTGPGVTPEKVDAFELGFKTASSGFSFNTAAFYYDYKGTQVNATITLPGGALVTQLFNVPKSRSYGVEADATLRLNDNFDIRAAAAYTHARYIDFTNAPSVVDDPTNPATLGGLLFANAVVDASGNNMVRAPDFTASGTFSYHAPVGDDDEFSITISPYYSSRVYFTFDNSQSQKAYATIDAAATLTLDGNMKISIFGRNLTDKRYFTSLGQSTLAFPAGKYAKPRVYGVSLGYSF